MPRHLTTQDLDLSYITPRIIAMGFPSADYEAAFRNPLSEVQRFFNTKHAGHYKIYNLCSERQYESSVFHAAERFPFNDHNTCPFTLLSSLFKSIDAWLGANPANVIGIHCKAGKGRTGLCVAAYLVHSGVCVTATDALKYFADARTNDGKGVTIPSQIRYVGYYEKHNHIPRLITDGPTYKVSETPRLPFLYLNHSQDRYTHT
jgi:phosphatidylinositol-3,4,5-trisphosphate 3-phosphatase/dual-specificity protein phosphatase PTEN